MRTIGTVVRMGRGKVQLSLLPNLAHRGLDIAGDAPGLKFAVWLDHAHSGLASKLMRSRYAARARKGETSSGHACLAG